eukprot:SAG11_NODE_2060_length_3874_cov_1.478146_1_plen_140_part_00
MTFDFSADAPPGVAWSNIEPDVMGGSSRSTSGFRELMQMRAQQQEAEKRTEQARARQAELELRKRLRALASKQAKAAMQREQEENALYEAKHAARLAAAAAMQSRGPRKVMEGVKQVAPRVGELVPTFLPRLPACTVAW